MTIKDLKECAEVVTPLVSALASAGWLAVLLVIIFKYRDSLLRLSDRLNTLELVVPGGGTLKISAYEAESIAQMLLTEMDEMIKGLDTEHKSALRKILACKNPTISSIWKDYTRGTHDKPSPELEILRTLRGCQLIRPARGGQFENSATELEIKPFGKILLKLRSDKLLD